MAIVNNPFDQYGIKEVADVTFFEIMNDGTEVPVLYLDTLKISTMEQTASETSARGGKGNPELISWDYNKSITLNLEDALFSMRSMEMIYANKDAVKISDTGTTVEINKTEIVTTGADGKVKLKWGTASTTKEHYAQSTETGEKIAVVADETDIKVGTEPGVQVRMFYKVIVNKPGAATVISINAGTFPGTCAA